MDILTAALRSLRAHPFFSALVILLLALGIGANTAIFGVVHAVLLKPLPYPEPGDLVMARKPPRAGAAASAPGGGDLMPDNEFLGWIEAQPKSFRGLAAYRNTTSTLRRADGAVRVSSAAVTGGFFPLLGVTPWRGRLFDAADLKPGAAPVTVLSHSVWQARFNGEDSALGQVVMIDDVAHTVVGVLPPSFEFTDPVQFWRPLAISPNAPGQLRITLVRVFGRLLPGTPLETAQRELDGISDRFWNNFTSGFGAGPGPSAGPRPAGSGNIERRIGRGGPGEADPGPGPGAAGPGGPGRPRFQIPFAGLPVQLMPLQEQLVRQSRQTLWLLLGAVGLVLLIACANVANLQLTRAAGRRRESAIRAALGASPGRLAAGLLVENLLLALLGGALGVLLAGAGTRVLQTWLADYLPRINPVGVNPSVLGFALLVSLAAGLGFGLAPAWQGSRIDLLETLKEGGPQASPRGHRWRQALVALEIALALVLAVNTGLLVRSLYRLYATELGFRTADVLTANLSLPGRYGSPDQQRDFAARWLAALSALPGVKTAALTDLPPLAPYSRMVLAATLQGGTGGNDASVNSAPRTMAVAAATPDFFRAAGVALRQGRTFTDQDGASAPAVAVVNEAFVREYYPQGLTLGAQVTAPGAGSHGGPPPTAAVVGVVADLRPRGFDSTAQPLVYFPLAQQPSARISAVLQFEGDGVGLPAAVVAATHRLDADLALDQPLTLEQQIARQTAPRRVTLLLTGTLAATAILLAALGIFGVMSYTVAQRTQEIGVRMALGAEPAGILRWVLRYGATAVAAGLAAGLTLTLATGRLLQSFLVGITALDPAVLAVGVLLLAGVGLLACLLPAWRATRVNPVEALRQD